MIFKPFYYDAKNESEEEKVALTLDHAKVELVPAKGGKETTVKESNQGSGKYEISVEPGDYKVMVKKVGFKVLTEQVQTKPGMQTFEF